MSRRLPFLVLMVACFFVPGLSAPAQSEANSLPAVSGKQMRFRIVDYDTAQPVEGVKVRAWVRNILTTDASGSCTIPLPRPTSENFNYRITLTKDGWVAKYITWSKAHKDTVEEMPAEYTVKMEKAASIGGIVENENREPLAGARILFSGVDTSDPTNRDRTTLAPNYHLERTDENGRWKCDHVPKHFEMLTFRVTQPEYAPAVFGCADSTAGGPGVVRLPAEEFVAGNAVMLMGHGIVLSGVIVDSQGAPVKDASITRNQEWRNPGAMMQADADGHFSLPNLREGLMYLTFQAKGLEPVALLVTNAPQMPALKVEMKPAKILKGRVLDESGKPVVNASVQMDRENLQPLQFDWGTNTDSEGRFVWDSAPGDPHPYLISAEGFNLRTESALVADGLEKIITLRKATGKTVIDGKVTDADGHSPVGDFTVLIEVSGEHGPTNFQQHMTSVTGEYAVAIEQAYTAYNFEFRAPGFLPFRTDPKPTGDGDQSLNIVLEKGTGLTGTVLLTDGSPAAGVTVALCTETDGATLNGRKLVIAYETNATTTSAAGTFVFPKMAGIHTIYAAGDQGFSEFDLTDAKPPFQIKLVQWGAIAGTASVAGKPLADAEMALMPPLPSPAAAGLNFSPDNFKARTDAQGNFVISNVPPIDVRLGRVIAGVVQNSDDVTIAAGTTTRVQYGGAGRVLAGRFSVPDYSGKINWTASQPVSLIAVVPNPDSPDFDDAAAKKKWVNEFWKSPDGKAWQRAQRTILGTVERDGSFKIEDVPPGKYSLRFQLREAPEAGGQTIASLSTNFNIEEAAAGAAGSMMDLGTITLAPAVRLRVGSAAPLFETQTTDGHPLKLIDYRGKYVLIDFWATWCGPCVAEMPNLKSVFEKFGKNPRFAMMSLSVDAQAAQPLEFARKNDIHWIQGFLGESKQSPVPDLYGVEGIPSIFLIGPDGKIVGLDLRGEAIGEAIRRALGAD